MPTREISKTMIGHTRISPSSSILCGQLPFDSARFVPARARLVLLSKHIEPILGFLSQFCIRCSTGISDRNAKKTSLMCFGQKRGEAGFRAVIRQKAFWWPIFPDLVWAQKFPFPSVVLTNREENHFIHHMVATCWSLS